MLLVVTEISNAPRMVRRRSLLPCHRGPSLLKPAETPPSRGRSTDHKILKMERLLQYLFYSKNSFYTDSELESGVPRRLGGVRDGVASRTSVVVQLRPDAAPRPRITNRARVANEPRRTINPMCRMKTMNRHNYPLIAAAVAAALSLSTTPAWAGDVVGQVTDANTGRPLPNATVRMPQLGRSTVADRSGEYRFANVPAGTHSVEVEYVGFGTSKGDVTVPESGEVTRQFSLGDTAETVTEVTVTGYRLAQITALQDKKASRTIKESVTANDAGKLPDQNAGETLARVTGVSVTTDQGEGRYVMIRGIDAALSNVTI